MKNIITKSFSNHLTNQFIESISEPANTVYYLVASRSIPFANGDTVPFDDNPFCKTI